MAKQEVVSNEEVKSVALFMQGDDLPAHLLDGTGAGNENVSADDMTIPRLDLIQQLSPQLDPSSPKFIEGVKLGDIVDSLSGEVFRSVFLMNLRFEIKWQVFKDRKLGGGFEGSFDTEAQALAHLDENNLPRANYNVTETAIHTCLMLDDQGTPKQPVLLYLSGSKMKVSKGWNSMITLKNPKADRFASVWCVTAVPEKNRQGQPYQNFKVDFAGWAPEAQYAAAKEAYLGLTNQSVH